MWNFVYRRIRLSQTLRGAAVAVLAGGGCSALELYPAPGPIAPRAETQSATQPRPALPYQNRSREAVEQASLRIPPPKAPRVPPIENTAGAEPMALPPVSVDELVRLAVERNPRIARASIAIDAAQGHYIQVGLYPNPELAFTWDEIGDRTGPGGIITAPKVTQTFVTGRKLSLAQAVASKEIDQAALDLLSERYSVVGSVRAAFHEVYALQRRLEILSELVRLADQGVTQGKTLLDAERIARLDLIQLEVEAERFRAEVRAIERELPAAYRKLTAIAGDSRLQTRRLIGTLDPPPAYDLEQVREIVLATHPEIRSARVAVERAQAAIRQAQVQPIPNITAYGGFIRQFENKSHDGAFGLAAPIPVWNQNQGNIRSARAQLGMAVQSVGRVENDLTERVATAFRTYSAARERAERYRREILPRAEETYKLSMEAFKGGQFEYLRVIQAQRAIAEARLELNRSLGEAWRAAGELSGLLLEEVWPLAPALPEPKPVPPEKP